MSALNESLEIRKLPINNIFELSRILEPDDSWKNLMAIIPKTLTKEAHKCDIDVNNPAKYRTEHFHLIETGAIKYRRKCTDILLDEWGTSGKTRPTIAHLHYLLQKAELFRAADYISTNILLKKPAPRPTQGPSAPVVLKPEEDPNALIEQYLDQLDYPSLAIENIHNLPSVNTNRDYSVLSIPKIYVSEDEDEKGVRAAFSIPPTQPAEVSDMIKFSVSNLCQSESDNAAVLTSQSTELAAQNNLPEFDLINSPTINESAQNIPDLSGLISSESNNSNNIPHMSILMANESQNTPNLSSLMNNSVLNQSRSVHFENAPAFSQLLSSSNNHTGHQTSCSIQLTSTQTGTSYNTTTTDGDAPSSKTPDTGSSVKISRSASSPLPNLTLNTSLPHFSYSDIQAATDNFNERHLNFSGRFLGEGAFGKVFLAVNLFEKPVAVKQLRLDNYEKVEAEDLVTKQFRTEVEVLSRYNHENLVSLLGYSCDGDTYCLLYEYIPGGALKDRLAQNNLNKLIWTERLYIAYGTAKAISYLHTAFDKPLIHRDVKSANILLDFSNKPKLCDFGLIKLTPTNKTVRGTTILGTSAYMSQEASRGDISVKLDSFSFGVVLLELLTSLPPWDDDRSDRDLVTHIQETCDDDNIGALLDMSAGSWVCNDVNVGDELFKLALTCLKLKRERPTMAEVTESLGLILQKCA